MMNKIGIKIRVLAVMLCLVVVAGLMPVMTEDGKAYAASRGTLYTQVIKSGNTVYCAGEGHTIYKVTLKKGKVKKVKKLVKSDFGYGSSAIHGMKKIGKYLYYGWGSSSPISGVSRVDLKTGKRKTIISEWSVDFAIRNKKIYYSHTSSDNEEKTTYKVCKLNGSNKKKGKKFTSNKMKRSNAKGYKVIYKETENYAKTYLKTPKGTFYLGKTALGEG